MTSKKLLLYFPKCETEKPIVYHLVKDYDLRINIFRAKVRAEEDGFLVIDVSGEDENMQKGIEFVKSLGITVNEGNNGFRWDQEKCTSCGNCLTHCPTKALHIDNRKTMEVIFDSSVCIQCLNCIDVCPFKACSSLF